jgi:CO dehydrogenase maturation factor
MGYIIAMAGKGGTGKTTTAALMVRLIAEKKLGSILAVDADPNSNLAEALGIEPRESIGQILDEISVNPQNVPTGMTKDRFIELKVQSSIAEGEGFDVLTMGKPEGPGCYCYVNNVLRGIMNKLLKDYDYIVIDNEAGLEHLSRRTTRSANVLLVVSDATVVGLKAAKRISELVRELKIEVKNKLLLVNRCDEDIKKEKIDNLGLQYIGNIPQDMLVNKISLNGNSLWDLEKESPALLALSKLGEKIWLQS